MELKDKVKLLADFDYVKSLVIKNESYDEEFIQFGFKGENNLHYYLSEYSDNQELILSIWKNKELIHPVKITKNYLEVEQLVKSTLKEYLIHKPIYDANS